MSCSPFDLRDYFLQELTDPQQRQVEAHVKTCQACREELDRLRLTEAALFSLRDEEIPQRIAFVSDKIFEPSPWRRWLGGVLGIGRAPGLRFGGHAFGGDRGVTRYAAGAPVPGPAPRPRRRSCRRFPMPKSSAAVDAAVDAGRGGKRGPPDGRRPSNWWRTWKDARKRLQLAGRGIWIMSERRGLRDQMRRSQLRSAAAKREAPQ